MQRGHHSLIAVMTAVIGLAGAGPAWACGGNLLGPVVEHGRIPGQSWSLISCKDGSRLDTDLSFPEPGGGNDGTGLQSPFPAPRYPLLVGASGGTIESRREGVADGVGTRTVAMVRLEFHTGPALQFPTQSAPAAERRRYRFLRTLRFFVAFYPGTRGALTRVCALSARGRVLRCEITQQHPVHVDATRPWRGPL